MAEPTKNTDAITATKYLTEWFAAFGVVTQWVSDRGSHFKNELVDLLRESLKANHRFTIAYCPSSNGTVEVVNRELLRATRALLSEFQLSYSLWPSVLPIVQSELNKLRVRRLDNRCPLEVFKPLPHNSPLTSIVTQQDETTKVLGIDKIDALRKINIDSIHGAMDNIHKKVAEKASKKRWKAVEAYNRKLGVPPANFDEGDFGLRGVLQRERGRKTSLRWKGSYRVVEYRPEYIFFIEDLLTSKKKEVHGRRLKLYRNKDFEVTQELADHLSYQQNELLVIERFDDIRLHHGDAELLVKWRGFNDDESDWVSLSTLREDAPVLVEDLLTYLREQGTQNQLRLVSSL